MVCNIAFDFILFICKQLKLVYGSILYSDIFKKYSICTVFAGHLYLEISAAKWLLCWAFMWDSHRICPSMILPVEMDRNLYVVFCFT